MNAGPAALTVRLISADAQAIHAEPVPDGNRHDRPDRGDQPDRAELWVCRPTAPALVMGSAQRREDFDVAALAAAGIDLASRRSGGGAVWIDPAAAVWVDLLAPRSSGWYDDDLTETFRRAGQPWLRALRRLGVPAEMFDGVPSRSAAARRVCWAGIGWGEITVDGVKVVGLSQRRTRWGARIQGMAVIDGRADWAAEWFSDSDPAEVETLRAAVGSQPLGVDRRELEDAVVEALLYPQP